MTAMTPEQLVRMLTASAALLGAVCLIVWGVERLIGRFFPRPAGAAFPVPAPMRPLAALRLALVHAPWIIVVTLALSWGCTSAAKALGWELPRQPLIELLLGKDTALSVKGIVVLYALVSAPILEELLFRRFLYRACLRLLPVVPATLVSAAVFAAVHRNLSVLLPILFLGSAFAVIYRRTGRLVAPIAAHVLFNLTNAVLAFACPELA